MLVNRFSLQDTDSFSQLFTRTEIIVFRFIYGLHGGPREEVEDLTCDTYLRAWRARHRFSGDDHDALCWLFTIARNLVIDAHRRKKTHLDDSTEHLDDIDMDGYVNFEQKSPEEQAVIRDQFRHVWAALQALQAERRELLVLRYLLGWQVRQIAGYLGMEENTVSVYIRRSLSQIRENWNE